MDVPCRHQTTRAGRFARCPGGGVVCVKPAHRELDILTVPALREQLAGLEATQHVLVDMADVVFCDCRGIGALVEAQVRQHAGGGSLHLVSVDPFIATLLSLCGLDSLHHVGPAHRPADPAVPRRGPPGADR